MLSSKNLFCFRAITLEKIQFFWPEIFFVGCNKIPSVHFKLVKHIFHKILNGMGYSGRTHEIIRLIMLDHQPHAFNIILCMSSIS